MNNIKRIFLLCVVLIGHSSGYAVQKIAVMGTGYVGLVSGAGLANIGNSVVCVDIDQEKIDRLNAGEIPIYEPGLAEVVERNVCEGRLCFTSEVCSAIQSCDIIIIAVGTPMSDDGAADLSYVASVARAIAQYSNGYKVICTKSTVPVGTGCWLKELLQQEGLCANQFDIVSNPEFLREGCAVNDFLYPDRVVIGVESEIAQEIMCDAYRQFFCNGVPCVLTNVATSEMIKYASNAFLAVKLSFINEMANLCDATGADVQQVAYAMGLDHRISAQFLQPGPGFGGSCFPKDSQALLCTAAQYGVNMNVVQASLDANQAQKLKPAQKVKELLGGCVEGKTIAILGLAFKANTDDIRYSPAIDTIQCLLDQGAFIQVYDPAAMENMKCLFPNAYYSESVYDAVTCADAVIVMTEWDEFKCMDLELVRNLMCNPIIVDTRNILDPVALSDFDFIFSILGRECLSH